MAASTVTADRAELNEDSGQALYLVVLGPGLNATHRLSPGASLLIGRAEDAPVRLLDPQASRCHARLHVGATVEIEELGSANGTRVRDQLIPVATRIALSPGDAVSIGDTVLTLRGRRSKASPRPPHSPASFEGRLIEECARAASTRGSFALLRLHVEGPLRDQHLPQLMEAQLRPGDVFVAHGPREYEVLLPDSAPAQSSALMDRLLLALRQHDLVGKSGMACYPTDGTSAQVLSSRANGQLLGAPAGRPETTPVIRARAMRELYDLARRVAVSDINVLILGETGVGKELLAEAVHAGSRRAGGRLMSINGAALTESLLEAELFGYEKGAFTGAGQAKLGLLEAAQGGTVFLDEIGEMSLAMQAKLLRAIESKQILRVGSTQPRPIDVRFVAATNRDLEEEIAQKAFRQDLYFRLNGVVLTIPPLRERGDEIEALAHHFVGTAAGQLGRSAPEIDAGALALLSGYAWPGNIRELRNVMELALLLCEGDRIEIRHLPGEKMRPSPLKQAALSELRPEGGVMETWRERLAANEREAIIDALARCAGNQTRAAELLGMPRRTFCLRLRDYNISRPRD